MNMFAQHRFRSFQYYAVSVAGMSVLANTVCAATPESGRALEEVIVSARKTDERLQDVPISVTAVGAETLNERGAVDLKDVLRSVPGLSFTGVERGQGVYTVRGVATLVRTPTTGIYLDDIPTITDITAGNSSGAFDAILFDMDRVEVLKGPQGTLYGGSAMGGAIKYVSIKPDLTETAGNVKTGVATVAHGDLSYNAEGVVNLPIVSETLAVRAGFLYRHDGGYVDNVAGAANVNPNRSSTAAPVYTPLTQSSLSTVSRENYNFSDTYVGRVSLLWQPDPTWSIRASALYQNYDLNARGFFWTNLPGMTSSYRYNENPVEDRGAIYSLNVSKSLGNIELTSLTSYFDRQVAWQDDYSFFIGNLSAGLYGFNSRADYPPKTNTVTQEFRVASGPRSDSRLSWVTGVYYSDQDMHFAGHVTTIGPISIFPDDIGYIEDTRSSVRQSALFGEVTVALSDVLDVTAGLRAFRVQEDARNMQNGPFNGGLTQFDLSQKEDGVNPKVGVSYKLAADNMLYASAAKGFRAAGVNYGLPASACATDLSQRGFDPSNPPVRFDSDSLWTYEVGSKNEFADGRLMLNGSVFYTDWKDIQQNISLACGFSFTVNAGKARIQGTELEMSFNVTPGLRIGGNATYTDAELVKAAPFGTSAHSGDQLPGTPEWMASAYGSYEVPLSATWDLRFRADYEYRGKARRGFETERPVTFPGNVRVSVPYSQDFIYLESYDVLGLSASLSNGRTNVRFYAQNALDEQPLLDTRYALGSSRTTTIRPQTIGIEMQQGF